MKTTVKLPTYLQDSINLVYTSHEQKIIEKGFKIEKRTTTFRINLIKTSVGEFEKICKQENIFYKKHPSIPQAYYLESEDSILWESKLIKDGLVYIQSLASQIPAHLVNLQTTTRVLDLAAAPGGKTSQLASLLGKEAHITALDSSAVRTEKLHYTLKKQGASQTTVMKIDARNYPEIHDGALFDCILFDAPCSAEGRINLNKEKTYHFLKPENNKRNYYLQREILRKNISLLREGGELIYSTCTLSPIENEGIVHFLLCNHPELEIQEINPVFLKDIIIKNGITQFGDIAYKKEVSQSIRILPSKETEGFFLAKFKKRTAIL